MDQSKEFVVLSLKKPGELVLNLVSGELDRLGFEDGQTNRGAVDPMGSYSITFDSQVGQVVDIDATDADLEISSAFPTDKAVLIPLGNIDGDANNLGDFIASVRDNVATQPQIDATPTSAHPHQMAGSSFVRVQLNNTAAIADAANDGTFDITLGANTLTLELPAPLLTASAGVQSHITSGDFDNDGKDDIAVLVSNDLSVVPIGTPSHPDVGLYVLYGRDVWCADPTAPCVINVTEEADVIFTGLFNPTSIVSPGDVIGTGGFDDILIGESGANALLLAGGVRDVAQWLSSRVLFSADFEDSSNPLDGFVTDNQPLDGSLQRFAPVDGLWHASTGRSDNPLHSQSGNLYFGRNETASAGGDYLVGDTAGQITRTFTIPAADQAISNLELRFNSLLETEGDPANADQARVLVSVNGAAFQTFADNDPGSAFSTINDAADPGGVGKEWNAETIPLGTLGTLMPEIRS